MSDPLDYTVAWVCSNITQSIAARAFLDEEHHSPNNLWSSLEFSYTFGRIWEHNLVIVNLTSHHSRFSLSRAAVDLKKYFLNVRICLMVGIGGGLPSQAHDIRLGDVVVGFANNGNDVDGQHYTLSGYESQLFLNTGPPPIVLSTAVTQLIIEYETAGNPLNDKIQKVFEKSPQLAKLYGRPSPASDRLYQSQVGHVYRDETCRSCGDDPSDLVLRNPRMQHDAPAVHYGLVGSFNWEITDSVYRDKISAETGMLCSERDAAGLETHCPCLLIRGISHYCDSHQGQIWGKHASIVAAAFAKELLHRIAPSQLANEASMDSDMFNGNDRASRVGVQQESERETENKTESRYGADIEDDAKGEDGVESTMSSETDIESLLSEGSHLSSQSSQGQLGSILIIEFAILLLCDNDLNQMYPRAIFKLGLAKFQRNFTRFLKRYGKDLINEASNELQRQAGQFVYQVARRTAAQVGKTLGQGGGKLPVEQLPTLSGSNLAVVDAWLNSHEQHDPKLGGEAFVVDSESSESEDENQTSLETLDEVKEFMVSTKAFSTLRQDFLDWLETGKIHGDKSMTKTTEPVLDIREDPEISHPISTRGLI